MSLLFLAVCGILLFVSRSRAVSDSDASIPATEYPLYAILSGAQKQPFSAQDLQLIASSFTSAQASFNSSTAAYLHSVNSAFKVVHYRNSWSSNDYPTVENDKQSVLVFPFALLGDNLTASAADTTVRVQLNPQQFHDITDMPIQATPAPFVTASFSLDCAHFVSWIRVDAEYMKVTAIRQQEQFASSPAPVPVPAANLVYELTVQRAFVGSNRSNSQAQAHAAGSFVFAPAYSAQAPGTATCPSEHKFSYAVNVQSDFAVQSLAADTRNDIATLNADGSWYDCFSASSFQAMSGTALQLPVTMLWDGQASALFTCNTYRASEQRRLQAIWDELELEPELELGDATATAASTITIFGNDMNYYAFASCGTGLLLEGKQVTGYQGLDGYCIEAYAMAETGNCTVSEMAWISAQAWTRNVGELLNATATGRNLAAMPMIAQAGCKSPALERLPDAEYQRRLLFGYVSFLLGVNLQGMDASSSKSPLKARFGVPAMRQDSGSSGQRYAFVHQMFFIRIGRPTQFAGNASVSAFAVGEQAGKPHVSYWRHFERGLVLINPTDTNDTAIVLPGGNSSNCFVNPLDNNRTVSEVSVDAHTAYLLLLQ